MATQLETNLQNINKKLNKCNTTVYNILNHIPPLPYIELEYIQSSGSQYINTGFKPNSNTKIIITFMKVGNIIDYERLFGSMSNSSATTLLRSNRSNSFEYKLNNSVKTSVTINANTQYTIEATNSYIKLNNSTSNFSAVSYTATTNLELLHNHDRYGTFRVYSCKVYDNGTLIRDFVPAKRKSDNVICLYDKVTETFYTNAGSGTFTAGPEA